MAQHLPCSASAAAPPSTWAAPIPPNCLLCPLRSFFFEIFYISTLGKLPHRACARVTPLAPPDACALPPAPSGSLSGFSPAALHKFLALFTPTTGIFIVSMDCTYYNPVKVNEKFRDVQCFTMPHLATVVISICISVGF